MVGERRLVPGREDQYRVQVEEEGPLAGQSESFGVDHLRGDVTGWPEVNGRSHEVGALFRHHAVEAGKGDREVLSEKVTPDEVAALHIWG